MIQELNLVGAFPAPDAILALYDDNIREGVSKLYPLQIKVLRSFASRKGKTAVVANNGAGKSKYLIAPCAIWVASNFWRASVVVTSSSGSQLDRQTGRYIKALAEVQNKLHREEFGGDDIWDIKYRSLFCKSNGSIIDLFATDEPGKAEGWHPIEDNGEFAIITDETKSIPEAILDAMDRCFGCTRRLDCSSPGDITGTFYDLCTKPELGWEVHKITAYDSPHITEEEIKTVILKHGINSAHIKSSIFAEFSSADGQVVINRKSLIDTQKDWKSPKLITKLRAGLDLSASAKGAETVLSVWRGHEQIGQDIFQLKDTSFTVFELIKAFKKWGLIEDNIYADDGGVGRAILDNLREQGWRVRRILNQSRAYDNFHYLNLATELWFRFGRLVEEGMVKFLPDAKLQTQLATKAYKRNEFTNQKIRLEAKAEAAAHGKPSPDRADACVLAWSMYSYPLASESASLTADTNSHLPTFMRPKLPIKARENHWEYQSMVRNTSVNTPYENIEKQFREYGGNV